MANDSLRMYAAGRGVRLWQIAQKFGIADSNFSRMLRNEFSEEKALLFKKFVDELCDEEGGATHEHEG